MKNNVIYYSKFNLDSMFAAMIVSNSLKHVEGTNTEVTCYERTANFTPSFNKDVIYIIGADVSPLHIGLIIEENPTAEIRIANYGFAEKYNDAIESKITHNLNNTTEEANDDCVYSSVSDMVFQLSMTPSFFKVVFPDTELSLFVKLMDAITKYVNFTLMTQEEILLIYKNFDNIVDTLEDNTKFSILPIEENDENNYAKYVKNLRVVITRNFSLRYYTFGTKWINVPTLSVCSEKALAIMRLISYSYDDIITYEDNSNFRLYRIYTKSNRDWYIKCIKANDVWCEGNLIFMKTPIPAAER